MEKAKLMQLEIEEKRKLPYSVKNNITNRIFQDLIVAAIIMAYFCIVNIMYYNFEGEKFETLLKYFSLIIIFATVIVFEIAYRKNSINSLVIGIELFICGVLSLYIPYIFLHTNSVLKMSIMLLPVILIVYYAIKSYAIYKKRQIQYHKTLSDVKEIVSENKKSYLDDISGKTFKDKLKKEKILKQKILEEQKAIRKKIN